MKTSKLLMFCAALLLGCLFFLPIWNITLEAPQYPDTIGMDIYINKFEGVGFNDIKNINIMNHYVGMKDIPEVIPEFSIFPYVVGAMVFLGLIIAFIGKRNLYLVWFLLMMIFGTIGMYDFYQWEYEYGHNLKEKAPIKFTDENGDPMSYQPPLIGAKTILNFRAISMPRIGAYLMALGMGFTLIAYQVSPKKKNRNISNLLVLLPFIILFFSCEVKPQQIDYGRDACEFCRMTIVDQKHAAQVVTKKGKAYKYDAIECMVNDLREWDRPEVKFYLVVDYESFGTFTDAQKANYLITESIPSPMGANLSAFSTKTSRDKIYDSLGGMELQWDQLQSALSAKSKN